jgi:hypothetical protein
LINNPRDSCARKEKEALLIDLGLEQHKRRRSHFILYAGVCENSLLFLIGSELLLQRGWKSTCSIFIRRLFFIFAIKVLWRGGVCVCVWRRATRALCVSSKDSIAMWRALYGRNMGIINLFIRECVCQRFDSLLPSPPCAVGCLNGAGIYQVERAALSF